MYKRAVSLLQLCSLMILMGSVCVRELGRLEAALKPILQLRLTDLERAWKERGGLEAVQGQGGSEVPGTMPDQAEAAQNGIIGGIGIADVIGSGQRVVHYSILEQGNYRFLSEDELEVLQRIVEAEAATEDEDGKLLVANVVLNRVDSDKFPDTVTEVVFQRSERGAQFSPTLSGRIHTVKISGETVAAVERALAGEDISQGALFFASRRYADSTKMRWFDEKLTYLFQHGRHEFYK